MCDAFAWTLGTARATPSVLCGGVVVPPQAPYPGAPCTLIGLYFFSPCTLNPQCTPNPTPCTLPHTLHPTPYTLHPAPYTLHPRVGGRLHRGELQRNHLNLAARAPPHCALWDMGGTVCVALGFGTWRERGEGERGRQEVTSPSIPTRPYTRLYWGM